jgi:predicted small secreted protein
MKLLRLGSVLLLMTAMTCAGGCNTVEGAGRDLEALGKNTSRAARENNPYRDPETPANTNPYR